MTLVHVESLAFTAVGGCPTEGHEDGLVVTGTDRFQAKHTRKQLQLIITVDLFHTE